MLLMLSDFRKEFIKLTNSKTMHIIIAFTVELLLMLYPMA